MWLNQGTPFVKCQKNNVINQFSKFTPLYSLYICMYNMFKINVCRLFSL